MKIAVCDDDRNIREDLEERIRRAQPESEIFCFESGDELLKSDAGFDIIFLDIQMDGPDGMETAGRLRRNGCRAVLIFVTAYQDYVFDAFDVGAFHYLVKPYDRAKLLKVLNCAVESLKEIREKEKEEEAGILIKQGTVTRKIYLSEILCLEVLNRKITLHKTDGGELEFYGKLTEYERLLGQAFARPHRAYMVNLKYVEKYDASEITLERGSRVPVAKQKYGEFVRKYMDYLKAQQEKQKA